MASPGGQSSVFLGSIAHEVTKALRKLGRENFVERIWQCDHTLWRGGPLDVQNRLGWLTSANESRDRLVDIQVYADSLQDEKLTRIVILGMGGSALGPLVLGQAFSSNRSASIITVLDTTVPDAIEKLTESLDFDRTLFIVASKSGDTIEPIFLYRYFRQMLNEQLGIEPAGRRFIAITDPGSPLVALAREEGFDRTFEGNRLIGGRFSVLSAYGLLPTVMAGFNVTKLLSSATAMAAECQTAPDLQRNPGAVLGAFMAACSDGGRDKMTVYASPTIASFGIWGEQLIAESLGKEGRGIIPVVGEPLLPVKNYRDDRAFIYLRLEGDDNAQLDVHSERVAAEGHPIVRMDLPDIHALGAELFRWEFAVAAAGFLIDVQPFDEPNVQSAKDATAAALQNFEQSGDVRGPEITTSIDSFLRARMPGDYLALLAYIRPTESVDWILQELRRTITDRFGLVTTIGYGPRYLHSTGQLHKGGPRNGAFVQFIADPASKLPIPGTNLTFGAVALAQANGDFAALELADLPIIRMDLGFDPESGLLRTLARLK